MREQHPRERFPIPSLRGLALKSERRRKKDLARLEKGVTEAMRERDRTLNCHYAPTERASRRKGRARFKTGKK